MVRKLLVALALLAGLTLATPASPAQASNIRCYTNSICFWDTATSFNPLANCEVVDCGVGDCRSVAPYTSYISNNNGYRWYVFTGSGCTGTRGTIYPYSQGSMAYPYNNSIRSYYRTYLTY